MIRLKIEYKTDEPSEVGAVLDQLEKAYNDARRIICLNFDELRGPDIGSFVLCTEAGVEKPETSIEVTRKSDAAIPA